MNQLSNDLIQARIDEAVAQRRYDFTTLVASSLISVVALALPILVAIVFWSDSEHKRSADLVSRQVETTQTRYDELIEKCLAARADPKSAPQVLIFYCETQPRAVQEDLYAWAAVQERVRQFDPKIRWRLAGATSLVFMVGAYVVFTVKSQSDTLTKAQARRIHLEARAPGGATVPVAGRRSLRRRRLA